MQIVREKVTFDELKKMSAKMYDNHDNLVKVGIDIENNIMVIGVEMHADAEAILLEQGSQQENLWSINIYPHKLIDDWIGFNCVLNLRPYHGNNTCGIDDVRIQEKIKKIVNALVVQ